jgi:hypothetical protein
MQPVTVQTCRKGLVALVAQVVLRRQGPQVWAVQQGHQEQLEVMLC